MWIEILSSILAAVISIIASFFGIASYGLIRYGRGKNIESAPISYSEKMAALNRSLVDGSREVDRVLKEMAEVAHKREIAISELEQELKALSEREKHLQEKVTNLEKVPLPAMQYFVSEMERGEKRSTWRDYILFGAGAIVSTVIAIVLKLAFGI